MRHNHSKMIPIETYKKRLESNEKDLAYSQIQRDRYKKKIILLEKYSKYYKTRLKTCKNQIEFQADTESLKFIEAHLKTYKKEFIFFERLNKSLEEEIKLLTEYIETNAKITENFKKSNFKDLEEEYLKALDRRRILLNVKRYS